MLGVFVNDCKYKICEAEARVELTHNGFAIRCIPILLLGLDTANAITKISSSQ